MDKRYRVDYTHYARAGADYGHETVTAESPEQAREKFLDSRAFPIDYDINGVRED